MALESQIWYTSPQWNSECRAVLLTPPADRSTLEVPGMVDSILPSPRTPSPKLCECGCGQPAPIAKLTNRRQGTVKGQPQRFVLGHRSRLMRAIDPLTRYVVAPNGCWLWQGPLYDTGYGMCSLSKRVVRHAHCVIYELLVGPVPEGMVLDHVRARGCTNRHCVNPAHLEPVTMTENTRRGRATKLTVEKVRELRALVSADIPRDEIATRFGVSVATVGDVANRRSWRDVA
jgi:hypothetical protein